ncbi:hypothetical protein B0H66DRAFT_605162 [Apodospora peruviana]|uniref:Uncharacterized protein n=1 Tax=Apodospora peruviana TaxID=516989 RepID=A0AAE0M2Q0_9PEZI|nr:hypothetical protein B0H66DRAFT_605162 [Apodospora peruviana]
MTRLARFRAASPRTKFLLTLDIFILGLSSLASGSPTGLLPWKNGDETQPQHPLLPSSDLEPLRKFSVGISLQPSYGAAAIIFDEPDGNLETHTSVVQGDGEYRRTMAKLSLESSQHVAPPYKSEAESLVDLPRIAARRSLMSAGLPASHEVGVLARVIQTLRHQLEQSYRIEIKEAVFTATHLLALYEEDLRDAASHAGIRYFTASKGQTYLYDMETAYVGYVFGRCQREGCAEKLSHKNVLAMHYTRNVLTVSFANLPSATWAYAGARLLENFTLGAFDIDRFPSRDEYWMAIRDALLDCIRVTGNGTVVKPDVLLVTGDMVTASERFMKVLKTTMDELFSEVPEVLDDNVKDPVTVAAVGAAESPAKPLSVWEAIKSKEHEDLFWSWGVTFTLPVLKKQILDTKKIIDESVYIFEEAERLDWLSDEFKNLERQAQKWNRGLGWWEKEMKKYPTA